MTTTEQQRAARAIWQVCDILSREYLDSGGISPSEVIEAPYWSSAVRLRLALDMLDDIATVLATGRYKWGGDPPPPPPSH